MTWRALGGVLLYLLLVGCGTETATPPVGGGVSGEPVSSDGDIAGEYVSDGLPPPFDGGDVLRLTFGDGRVDFTVGCNGFGGDASWDSGTLRVGGLTATEMGCPGDGNAEEGWLADFLSSSPAITADGTDVRLADGDAEIWLVPADEVAPEPGPDVDLLGTRWVLVAIEEVDGDAVSMTDMRGYGAELTIDRHAVGFDTSCNTGGGDVRIVGDRLLLRNVFTTLRGCLDERGEIEKQVLAVLGGGRVEWSIAGQQLRLTVGRTSLLYRP